MHESKARALCEHAHACNDGKHTGDSPKPRVAKKTMFSSFQRLWWRAALFRLVVRHPEAVFNDKYARAVEKTSHQLEKRYGTRRGLSSTQRFSSHNDRSTSSLNVIDKSTNSTPEYQGHDIKQEKSRKKNLSLPTVYLPSELQAALDNAMSSKYYSAP